MGYLISLKLKLVVVAFNMYICVHCTRMCKQWCQWIPYFRCTVSVQWLTFLFSFSFPSSFLSVYIEMADLLRDFDNPSVMDIKMGTRYIQWPIYTLLSYAPPFSRVQDILRRWASKGKSQRSTKTSKCCVWVYSFVFLLHHPFTCTQQVLLALFLAHIMHSLFLRLHLWAHECAYMCVCPSSHCNCTIVLFLVYLYPSCIKEDNEDTHELNGSEDKVTTNIDILVQCACTPQGHFWIA